jgi:putative transposase
VTSVTQPGRLLARSKAKCIYLAILSLDPTGKGRKRWSNRWKAALNAFEITFDGRLSAGRN